MSKEKKTAALATQDLKEVSGLTEPNKKLNLMARDASELPEDDLREKLFTVKMQVKTTLVDAVIDSGSQKNLISETLVQKLGIETKPHPRPYPLGVDFKGYRDDSQETVHVQVRSG